VFAGGKGGVGQQQTGGLGALAAPAVPTDLSHSFTHFIFLLSGGYALADRNKNGLSPL
jgi:hypothetical protein